MEKVKLTLKDLSFETQRCKVRIFMESDLDSFIEYRNNEDWMRYQGFKGLTKEEYRESLLHNLSIEKGMQLAIINKENNDLIGDIYLNSEESNLWIGYTIHPNFSRKGYAFEIANGIIDWAREKEFTSILAGVEPDNVASIKLLEKLGLKLLTTDDGELIYKLNIG